MFGHDDKDKEEKDQAELGNSGNDSGSDWQHPGTPIDDGASDSTNQASSNDDAITPSASDDKPAESDHSDEDKSDDPDESAPSQPSEHPSNTSIRTDDLIDIKQEALGKLSPLVGHLDQSPAEKFRTLMMMIQASDDQSLIREAYETAQKIDDEKERAQALLDIVNEINYFTQNPGKSD